MTAITPSTQLITVTGCDASLFQSPNCEVIDRRRDCPNMVVPGSRFCRRHQFCETIDNLPVVRFRLWYDEDRPCSMRYRLLKANRKSITVVAIAGLRGRIEIKTTSNLDFHMEPCRYCPDHPETHYPEVWRAGALEALPSEYRYTDPVALLGEPTHGPLEQS